MSPVLMLWINPEDGKSTKTVQMRKSLKLSRTGTKTNFIQQRLTVANSQPDVNSN